ncbi:MAG: hypothetical protein Q8P26_00575 [Candidatus Levybacteria bacterium]|nr:hypothetical protein [Candidatus Levybacteria bacterium]
MTWHDALTIAAVIFAITQFMETTSLRRYIFYLGRLRKITVFLVGIPLISIAIGTFVPDLTHLNISSWTNPLGNILKNIVSFNVPYSSYLNNFHLIFPAQLSQAMSNPITYQIVAISSFTLLLLTYLAFLWNPKWFKPPFNEKLLDNLASELLDNLKREDIGAICRILGLYLEKIVSLASDVPRRFADLVPPEPKTNKEKLAARCLQFIEIDLSGDNIINYIAREDIRFTLWMVKYAEKYSLWRAGSNIFFDNLFAQLLRDKNSALTRELKLGGVSGITKPLSKHIFNSMEIIDNYDVFGALGWNSDVSEIVLTNVIEGLEISLKTYFTTSRGSYRGNPSMKLGRTIQNLSQCFSSICIQIAEQKSDIWGNKYDRKISIISGFYRNLHYWLLPRAETNWQDAYNPSFSAEDLAVQQDTVAEGIIEGLFEFLEGLSYLSNEKYARQELVSNLYWILYRPPDVPIIKSIQNKLLEKIKERVEENFKENYASMTKLFLNLYSGHLYSDKTDVNNPIASYFKDIYGNRIIPEIRKNVKYKESTLPSDWKFNTKGDIFRIGYKDEKIIIDKFPKKRQRKTTKKLIHRRKQKTFRTNKRK